MNSQATVIGTPGAFTGPGGGLSAAATAANVLYTASVEYMLREQDWEFSRLVTELTHAGVAPTYWTYAYTYPVDCVRVRQVQPISWNPLDPQPMTWGTGVIAGPTKAIFANVSPILLTYSSDSGGEALWDIGFQTALVRFLASRFAMALAGRPDFSVKLAEQAMRIGQEGFAKDS